MTFRRARKALTTTLIAAAAIAVLSGCEGEHSYEPADHNAKSFDYKGESLACSTFDRSASCDYDAFYEKHPDLIDVKAEGLPGDDDLHFIEYKGHVLTCHVYDRAMSCDYPEFYAAHPEALSKA